MQAATPEEGRVAILLPDERRSRWPWVGDEKRGEDGERGEVPRSGSSAGWVGDEKRGGRWRRLWGKERVRVSER
jgi:hypothetical protein